LSENLPASLREIIQRQASIVLNAHDRAKMLRDQAKAAA
jgi:hypothetical protein